MDGREALPHVHPAFLARDEDRHRLGRDVGELAGVGSCEGRGLGVAGRFRSIEGRIRLGLLGGAGGRQLAPGRYQFLFCSAQRCELVRGRCRRLQCGGIGLYRLGLAWRLLSTRLRAARHRCRDDGSAGGRGRLGLRRSLGCRLSFADLLLGCGNAAFEPAQLVGEAAGLGGFVAGQIEGRLHRFRGRDMIGNNFDLARLGVFEGVEQALLTVS